MSIVLRFHIWFIMTVYYKMRQVFYYKMRQFYYKMWQLLQIATILLQNATVITKCAVYYKLRQYKANIILLFVLQLYLSSPYRSNFVRDFSSSVRIDESILMSSFMRHLRRSGKFWQRRKKWVVNSDSKLQGRNGFVVSWELWLNLCSLRSLKPKHNLVRSLISRLSEISNKLLGEGLFHFISFYSFHHIK